MAIFSSKKEKKEVKSSKEVAIVANTSTSVAHSTAIVIRRPRITEKASLMAESQNVYVFEVENTASKPTVAEAIRELYKVTPEKIRITSTPSKQVFVRGKWGIKSGGKKAYVYLKKGDKIEIV